MLLALSIRDFAIVGQLDLELATGFTVLTGETGAGKSILIDALQFALGGRAHSDTVRAGASRAEVAAEFRPGPAAAVWLRAAGLDSGASAVGADGTDGTVLLRRTLDKAGRGRSFINGAAATLGQLRELGELLLDIHGQHEYQRLLRPAAQQQLLDDHGGLQASAQAVAGAYAAWRQASAAHADAAAAQARAAEESGMLQRQLEDLQALAPGAGEWELLETEQRRLAHGAALLEAGRSALDVLAEGEDAVQARLARLGSRLAALQSYDQRLSAIVEALASAGIQTEEAVRALRHYLAGVELDEGRLAQLEERIANLHAAGRRWRCSPAALPNMLAAAEHRLEHLRAAQDSAALRRAEEQAAAVYAAEAQALSAARAAAAQSMSIEVSRAMQDLAMSGGCFEVLLHPGAATASGYERVEFLVSGHAGGTPRPLAKVASGGELARIGLAIAVIAAAANPVATLIFDEVDAGIGGQVAATVGRLLRALGHTRQVLCVTHLPQVAACGDQHLAVHKRAAPDGRIESQTLTLSGQDRVLEIARMLGGARITALTEQHAREMLAER